MRLPEPAVDQDRSAPATPPPMLDTNHLLVLAALFLLVAFAYGNTLGNRFTMDDDFIIVDNPMISNLRSVPKLFATDYWAREGATDHLVPRKTGLYRPLVLTSYAINNQMTGLEPWSYHLVNVLLHFLCTWFVFLIARQIGVTVRGSAVAAAVFALHPLHTEAVSGIVGRSELMMSVGMLGGLWLAGAGQLWLSLCAFLLGLFSKEQAVMLPGVIILYDLCMRKRIADNQLKRRARRRVEPVFSKSDLRRYGSYCLVLVAYLIARDLALGTLSLPPPAFLDNPLAFTETGERVLTALKIAGQYLWLMVWPVSLSADYSYNAIETAHSFLDPGVLFGALMWGGLAVWMVRAYVNGDRRASFSIGFTILVFLPVSNILLPIGTIMGERLFYLPSAGLCWLVGVLWDRFQEHSWRSAVVPTAARILLALICLAFLVRTAWRNLDWVDNRALFLSAGKVVPSSAKMRAYLGRVSQLDRDWNQARSHYEAAAQIYSGYVRTDASLNVNLGDVYFKLGEFEKAEQSLDRAIRLAPASAEAHYNLGLVYARLGRYGESEPQVREALSLRPHFPEAENTLSRLLVEFGRHQEALAAADKALSMRPGFREALYNRGLALRGLGRTREADDAIRLAIEEANPAPQVPGAVAQ